MSDYWKRFFSVQLVLAVCCIFCIILLGLRVKLTGRFTYSFMIWNLFLGCIPLAFAILLRYFSSNKNSIRSKLSRMILFSMWLLFFPNAIYMVSDLLHLSRISSPEIPNWYDAIMLFGFAMTGLFLSLVSLRYVHVFLKSRYSNRSSWIIVAFAIILCGFGVYLGRFLRWNSWDIIQDPFGLFNDILQRLIHPFAHFEAYFVTGVFTIILFSAYLLMNLMRDKIE
jgi:uncharacterized membrane protein